MEVETVVTPVVDTAANGEVVAEVAEAVAAIPVEVPMAQTSQSWYEMLRAQFPETVPAWALEVGVFGVGSFLLGFLFKCCGRLLTVALVVGIAVLLGLHYSNVMPLDVTYWKALLGLADVTAFQEVPAVFFAWGKEHVVACVSVVVGFMLGWKLG